MIGFQCYEVTEKPPEWPKTRWEREDAETCKCGRKLWTYVILRKPEDLQMQVGIITNPHKACRRCDDNPLNLAWENRLGPRLPPEWERGKNWFRKNQQVCETCGERRWDCCPCAEGSGIQVDVAQSRCRVCPLEDQERPSKPAYIQGSHGIWVPNPEAE
jgi:hypothetical protein